MSNKRYVIGIGAQKAGTTWLSEYVSGLPEVFVSPIKELHFFDMLETPVARKNFEKNILKRYKDAVAKLNYPDLLSKSNKLSNIKTLQARLEMGVSIESYKRFFNERSSDRTIHCEITPSYALLSIETFRLMRQLSQDVRLIFLLRNPKDRFWSAVRMLSNNSKIGLDSAYEQSINDPVFLGKTNYSETISRLNSAFDSSEICIEFYENLFKEKSIRRICSFIGAEYQQPDFDKRVWEGVSAPLGDARKIEVIKRFEPVYRWAQNQFGDSMPDSWREDLLSLNT